MIDFTFDEKELKKTLYGDLDDWKYMGDVKEGALIGEYYDEKKDFDKLIDGFVDTSINANDLWKNFADNYLEEDGFIMAVFNMMKGWIHGT